MSEVKKWLLQELNGDGRGSVFFNSESEFVDPISGVKVLGWEGYDDEDDDDWDDFGSQYYQCTLEGTEDQVILFIKEHFYEDGEYSVY